MARRSREASQALLDMPANRRLQNGEVDVSDIRKLELEMVCTCKPDGSAAAERARLTTRDALGAPPSELATAVCLSLAWEHGAAIRVASDMWYGVWIVFGDESGYVECDNPLDGMIALWTALEMRRPGHGRLGAVATVEHEVVALSRSQIAALTFAHDAYEAHKVSCSECVPVPSAERSYHQCSVARQLLGETEAISQAIDGKWTTGNRDAWRDFHGYDPDYDDGSDDDDSP